MQGSSRFELLSERRLYWKLSASSLFFTTKTQGVVNLFSTSTADLHLKTSTCAALFLLMTAAPSAAFRKALCSRLNEKLLNNNSLNSLSFVAEARLQLNKTIFPQTDSLWGFWCKSSNRKLSIMWGSFESSFLTAAVSVIAKLGRFHEEKVSPRCTKWWTLAKSTGESTI